MNSLNCNDIERQPQQRQGEDIQPDVDVEDPSASESPNSSARESSSPSSPNEGILNSEGRGTSHRNDMNNESPSAPSSSPPTPDSNTSEEDPEDGGVAEVILSRTVEKIPCNCLFFFGYETCCAIYSALGCLTFFTLLVMLCMYLAGSFHNPTASDDGGGGGGGN